MKALASSMLAAYYRLTKPGIIYGNVMTTIAGFLLASKNDIDVALLLATALGTAFVIGGACVINNYIDRRIDGKMARTKKRSLVNGDISPMQALVFGSALGASGFALLAVFTNMLTLAIGTIGVLFYLVMYSVGKRRSQYGTLIGSVAGATPIVAGYTAASSTFDMGAVLLFGIMAIWQMPHFYAIAMFRLEDYRAAGLPVWPIARGITATKRQITYYVGAYIIAAALLTAFDYTGYVYLIVMTFFGFSWLRLAREGFKTTDNAKWARKMFGLSLTILLAFSLLISLEVVLP